MEKVSNSLFANYFPIATGMLAGFMLCYVVKLFLSQLLMVPFKYPWVTQNVKRVANTDYVHIITKQRNGDNRYINIPVYYGQSR